MLALMDSLPEQVLSPCGGWSNQRIRDWQDCFQHDPSALTAQILSICLFMILNSIKEQIQFQHQINGGTAPYSKESSAFGEIEVEENRGFERWKGGWK